LLPHGNKIVVDDAGHMAPYEQPDAVERAIMQFLG
jgi:pimeloyl-ACP methyl ester carboxylesterase